MASFDKRGEFWRAQIRRNGYPLQSRTFDTKPEAQAWARSVESDMDRGTYRDNREAESTTLAEALDRYGREFSSRKAHPDRDLQRIKRWQQYPLAQRHMATLRGTDFAAYRDTRRQQGRAENTIRLELQLASHLFEMARKEWGWEGLLNPLKNIRKPSGTKARDRRLHPGERERLAAALAESDNSWAAPAFELAIETTLRQGMLFELRWSWIDLGKRVVTIPRSYHQRANKGVPHEIPLSSKAVTVLQAMPRSIDGRVFGCTANAALMIWKRVLKRLAIDDLRWHDLRHEGVSRLFEKGMSAIEASSISGHKSFVMLKRYTHLRAVDLLAKIG
ncbi:site-specific integrase [Variovorax sp. EL159]|uniref:integrase n=1 Tax=Variovorax sp. EL159 TaxID=1566270 RepID=UPI00087F5104|nr:site-specific integrase [Variovorax sp. EL159]SCX48645.1 Phage integrase family protein [Variovorax sp. EL159]